MRRPLGPIVAVGVAALLLVAGCSGDPGPAPSSPVAEPTPSATERVDVEPSPEAGTTSPSAGSHPALEDLVVSPSGLGPLTVGPGDPADNPGAAMLTWDEDACVDVVDEGDRTGLWRADYGQDTNYLGETVEPPFFVQADAQGLQRIDLMGETPSTEEGIRIGSTLVELQEAYPELEGPFDGPVSRVWWITEDAGSLVFETQDDSDGLRPAGTEESVILIRVLAPSWSPEFATANSGDVAGACF